jgi:hypothetical protein
VGKEKEKERYWGKGYKFSPGNQMATVWQPNGNQGKNHIKNTHFQS